MFSGHNIIAENGTCLSESKRFANSVIISELDIGKLVSERRRMTSFKFTDECESGYEKVEFKLNTEDTVLTRKIDNAPFVPGNKAERDKRCNEILAIQAMGLKKDLCIQAVNMQ